MTHAGCGIKVRILTIKNSNLTLLTLSLFKKICTYSYYITLQCMHTVNGQIDYVYSEYKQNTLKFKFVN